MTKSQYEILINSPYISTKEIMNLYQVQTTTAIKIKKELKLAVLLKSPHDFKRFPPNGKLPTIYMLKNDYLPFSLDDVFLYQKIHSINDTALENI